MDPISSTVISQYAIQYGTPGDAQAADSAAKAIVQSLGLELSTAEFDSLKARLMSSAAPDPTGDLPKPGDIRGATGASLAGMDDQVQVEADIYSFMALFQKLAQTMRDSARQERTANLQGQVTALLNAADKMKAAGEERYKAGVAQAWGQIAGGIMQMGASAVSLGMSVKGANQTRDGGVDVAQGKAMGGTKGLDLIKHGKGLEASGAKWGGSATAMQGMGGGASGIAGGAAGLVAAGHTKEADKLDAERAKLDALAKQSETNASHASDAMQQNLEIIRDCRDKMQSMQQAAVETTRGMARNV
jgi:hypothetical protein